MLRLSKTGRTRVAGALSVALLAVSLPLSLIGAAGAADTPSELTIRWNQDKTRFAGRVKSEAVECLPNRLVRVFKVKKGPDKRLGSDLTDTLGRWRVDTRRVHGRIYARVAPSSIGAYYGEGDTCGKARSKTIRVPGGGDDDDDDDDDNNGGGDDDNGGGDDDNGGAGGGGNGGGGDDDD